ncbi:hypothetical protein CsSME_00017097 [Camellia sinensis var. sinensis]
MEGGSCRNQNSNGIPWIYGKKGIEGFERACQAEIIGTRDSCYTANFKCFKMHADSSPCAISDPVQKDPDVGRESGTPETAPTETCKRTKFADRRGMG